MGPEEKKPAGPPPAGEKKPDGPPADKQIEKELDAAMAADKAKGGDVKAMPEPKLEKKEIVGGPGSIPEFLKEPPVMKKEEIVGGPGSIPEFLKEKPELKKEEIRGALVLSLSSS